MIDETAMKNTLDSCIFYCFQTVSLYNFVGDTIKAFIDSGMNYYNEIILYTLLGSLPIRAGNQMNNSRKIGKTHQNVLVFYKSAKDNNLSIPKNIQREFGEVIADNELFSEEFPKEFVECAS